jgi:hypothetical protein
MTGPLLMSAILLFCFREGRGILTHSTPARGRSTHGRTRRTPLSAGHASKHDRLRQMGRQTTNLIFVASLPMLAAFILYFIPASGVALLITNSGAFACMLAAIVLRLRAHVIEIQARRHTSRQRPRPGCSPRRRIPNDTHERKPELPWPSPGAFIVTAMTAPRQQHRMKMTFDVPQPVR